MTSQTNDRAADVTRVLDQLRTGDAQAAEALLPLVYEQLRSLAASKMRNERPDQTLQATALVHEAYLRVVDQAQPKNWDSRWHFFAAAAEAMRRILVEQARRRNRLKRGGGAKRVSMDEIELVTATGPTDVLALDEALDELAKKHPQNAELVKLRYFGGLTTVEAGEALGVSERTARRLWNYSRAWLYTRITSA
jgi:RNA polymerase sigma factor (TIGR02999 family)